MSFTSSTTSSAICVVLLLLTIDRLGSSHVILVPQLFYQSIVPLDDMSRIALSEKFAESSSEHNDCLYTIFVCTMSILRFPAKSKDTEDAKYRHAISIRLMQKRSCLTVSFTITSCSISYISSGCSVTKAQR